MDTLYYLIDGIYFLHGHLRLHYLICLAEIPVDSKSLTFDPFRSYPQLSPTSLPSSMPFRHVEQLRSLLFFIPTNTTVRHLVTAHHDASNRLIFGEPVANRPWEWIENLGEPPSAGGDGDTKGEIKNSASISLDLFAARLVGDAVVHSGSADPRIEANLRSFEDGLSSESLFKRDWRESRVSVDVDDGNGSSGSSFVSRGVTKAEEAEETDEITALPVFGNTAPGSRRGSPKSSSRGGSVGAGSSSARASPLHMHSLTASKSIGSMYGSGAGSAAEPIVIDAPGELEASGSGVVGMGAKRKLDSVSDDDIEIIEGPRPTRAGKKPKGKTVPAGKTTAKTMSKARKRR